MIYTSIKRKRQCDRIKTTDIHFMRHTQCIKGIKAPHKGSFFLRLFYVIAIIEYRNCLFCICRLSNNTVCRLYWILA